MDKDITAVIAIVALVVALVCGYFVYEMDGVRVTEEETISDFGERITSLEDTTDSVDYIWQQANETNDSLSDLESVVDDMKSKISDIEDDVDKNSERIDLINESLNSTISLLNETVDEVSDLRLMLYELRDDFNSLDQSLVDHYNIYYQEFWLDDHAVVEVVSRMDKVTYVASMPNSTERFYLEVSPMGSDDEENYLVKFEDDEFTFYKPSSDRVEIEEDIDYLNATFDYVGYQGDILEIVVEKERNPEYPPTFGSTLRDGDWYSTDNWKETHNTSTSGHEDLEGYWFVSRE